MRELTNGDNSGLPAFIVEFQAITKPTTYTDIVSCTSAKLRPFTAKYGLPAMKELISFVLLKLASSLGKPIDGEHLEEVAEYIIEDFPDTKLSDFHMFRKEMLRGSIGGQVGDQLWHLNTRTLNQAWAEYYARREDVFCEAREQRYQEEKRQYNDGFARSFANASPETQQKHREWVAKMAEKIAIRDEEKAQKSIPQKLTLEQIAESEGIDTVKLAEAIQTAATTRQIEENLKIPMMLILQAEMASVLFNARQDGKFLHGYIESLTLPAPGRCG